MAYRLKPLREQRVTYSQTLQDLLRMNTGEIVVTEHNALHLSSVWACVRVISETIAQLPVHVYSPGNERAESHYLQWLLHDEPNPEMTAFTFRETLMAHLLTWGNAYAEIEWSNNGRAIALWPLRPDLMSVRRNEATKEIEYHYSNPKRGLNITLGAGDLIHVPGLGFDGLIGYSPVRMAEKAIQLGLCAEKYGNDFFSNSNVPSGILKHPGVMDPEAHARVKEDWQDVVKNRGVGVLEEGLDFVSLGIPNNESQFLETRRFQVEEIARIFRVPLHKIGELSRATFSNIEHQAIEFVQDTILPWCIRWEQEITRKLLPYGWQVKFNPDGLLRGDTASRYAAYNTGRQGGWLSVNDIRRKENLPPIPGGDEYLSPLNMRPAGEPQEQPQEPAKEPLQQPAEQRTAHRPGLDDETAVEAFTPVLADVLNRMKTKEQNALGKADEARRLAFISKHRDTITEAITPVFASVSTLHRKELNTRALHTIADSYIGKLLAGEPQENEAQNMLTTYMELSKNEQP